MRVTINQQPSLMPSVVGETAPSAIALLNTYGAESALTEILSTEGADNVVVAQNPASGKPSAPTSASPSPARESPNSSTTSGRSTSRPTEWRT